MTRFCTMRILSDGTLFSTRSHGRALNVHGVLRNAKAVQAQEFPSLRQVLRAFAHAGAAAS